MNSLQFTDFKQDNQRLSMVTCYDYTSACIVNDSPIDVILVGDSSAMVMQGHKTTLPATVDTQLVFTQAVVNGAPSKFIVADMPFGSTRQGKTIATQIAMRFMQAGAHAIKIEGAVDVDIIEHLVLSGIPVMGHIGLTPQFFHTLGGFKVQGTNDDSANLLIEQAKMLERVGCFALVLECMPAFIGQKIDQAIKIATIGIGAGPHTTGQILIWHDIMGLTETHPRFVKKYIKGRELFRHALKQFHHDVTEQHYPEAVHCYKA